MRNREKPATMATGALIVVLSCAAVSCTGNPLIDTALSIGKNMLSAAASNYAPSYSDDLTKLVEALVRIPEQAAPENTALASLDAMDPGSDDEASDSPSYTSSLGDGTVTPDTDEITSATLGSIELDISLLKEVQLANGVYEAVPLEDGDVVTKENLIKLKVRTNMDCYLYIASVDGTGWAQPLFPGAADNLAVGHSNPVSAGVEYNFPEGDEWYELDNYTGVETLFFVASHVQRPDLEKVFAKLALNTRPELDPATAAAVTEPAVVTRGFGGKKTGRSTYVTTSDRKRHSIKPAQFISKIGTDALVITRYFQHD